MRTIKIYNTLTRKKEVFKPIVKDHVGMYVCGPTVYGDPHLGHARPAITFDVVFRYLKQLDFKVRYVRNITDAGHLENDAEQGEDKITKKARFVEDLGDDSLDTVEILMDFEEEFDVEIPDEDAEKILSVNQAMEYINNKLDN